MSALAVSRAPTPMSALAQHSHMLVGSSERLTEGPFHAITQGLMSLGACALEDLARIPEADLLGLEFPLSSKSKSRTGVTGKDSHPSVSSAAAAVGADASSSSSSADKESDVRSASSQPTPPDAGLAGCNGAETRKPLSDPMQFVAKLHQTCVQTFGNSDALKFEFLEEDGPDRKQCILTIARPNGSARSYTSEAVYSRKSDAKARAAAIAVDMGAVDFILHGNKDNSKSRSNIILAPIDSKTMKEDGKTKSEENAGIELEDDEASKQIMECCTEWRAGLVKPRWVFFSEHKGSSKYGSVLIVELSTHSKRLYSVQPKHDTNAEAKRDCSETALQEGVLDYIKYGNGQMQPAEPPTDADLTQPITITREPEIDRKGRFSLTLEDFFDTLPKPFPEPLGDKPVSEVNAAGLLNTTLQLAKGARLTLTYHFITDGGLHGCIIRLVRPEETRTYFAEPKFSKRIDAKAAACLLAMSQGIGQYIRSIASDIEGRVTSEMRKVANEQILPILGSEYAKLRHGMHPSYEYDHDQGAFGCTLVLALSEDPKPEEIKKWTVKPDYRTKTDAKVAVVYTAGKDAIEFVRFRGGPVPPDHDPFKPYKRIKEPQIKREDSAPPIRASSSQAASSSSSTLADKVPTIAETKEGSVQQKAEKDRQRQEELQKLRPNKKEYSDTRRAPRSASSASYANGRNAPSYRNLDAAASAVIDRVTQVQNLDYSNESHASSSVPHYTHSTYSRSSYDHTRDRYDRTGESAPPYPHYATPVYSSTHVSYLSTAASPKPPGPSSHYPQDSSNAAHHYAAYASGGYPAHYGHAAYPYAMYPSALHGYAMAPPPATSPPDHPPPMPQPPSAYPYPYAAYYPDPRYGHYAMPAMAYAAVALTPTAYGYPSPAMSGGTQPMHAQWPVPNTAPVPAVAGPSTATVARRSASVTSDRDSVSMRSTSVDVSERPKRPRSRQGTPEDAARQKKQRPESLSTPASAKKELTPETPTPAPLTPVSEPDVLTSIEQLKAYCKKNKLDLPEFSSRQTKTAECITFKVWMKLGKERYELPSPFSDEDEGRQKLAKQVLQRLQSSRRPRN